MVVAVAGAVEHEQVVDEIGRALGDWERGVPSSWFPAVNGQNEPRVAVQYKRTEQAHIEMAMHALSSQDPDRFALDLISVILGEGMSSRLFVELREQRALCYDVHSYASHYLDAGSFAVYAGVDPKKTVEATQALVEELAKIRADGVTDEELHKAKELSKGRLLLRMEDTRSVSGWLGGQEMLSGEVKTPDEVVALMEAVTPDDVRRVAREVIDESQSEPGDRRAVQERQALRAARQALIRRWRRWARSPSGCTTDDTDTHRCWAALRADLTLSPNCGSVLVTRGTGTRAALCVGSG